MKLTWTLRIITKNKNKKKSIFIYLVMKICRNNRFPGFFQVNQKLVDSYNEIINNQ